MRATKKVGLVRDKGSKASASKPMADLEKRVADLERKLNLKATRRASKKLQERITVIEEWTTPLAAQLNDRVAFVNTQINRLTNATEILFRLIDRFIPDESPEESAVKSGLGVLVDRGGGLPVDGNAVRIFRGPLP